MKILKKISLSIVIITTLVFLATLIVNIVIINNYKNFKTCRKIDTININNYSGISNVIDIKILDECDKLSVYILLDNTVTNENINAIILQFVDKKIIYNDDSIIELIIRNDTLNYIVIIDKDERIDIDFEN